MLVITYMFSANEMAMITQYLTIQEEHLPYLNWWSR